MLLDPAVIDDPYPFYRQLHETAPVWWVPGTDVYVISSFALVAEATTRIDDFSNNMNCLLYRDDEGLPARLPFGVELQALATADPPLHTVHRSTVFPELVAKRMVALEPEIEDLARECLDQAVVGSSVDFMARVGNVVPIEMISRLIGFHDADRDRLLDAAFKSTAAIGSTLTLAELEVLVATIGDIEVWIADQLSRVADSPGDDILGAVARGVDSGALAAGEAAGMLHTLLSAGGESTTSLLGSAVRMLAEQPDLQEQLRREPELVPAFVEEALRLESPFRYLLRSVPRSTTIGEVDIPDGATVLLLWGAANRDASEYERPDEVDLERKPLRHHLAFGRGIHHCVGAPLARLEARIVLTELLACTRSITLDDQRPPRWVNSLLVRRHDHLPVKLEPVSAS
jgi:cytochrome P450